jgi:hypothetical protein
MVDCPPTSSRWLAAHHCGCCASATLVACRLNRKKPVPLVKPAEQGVAPVPKGAGPVQTTTNYYQTGGLLMFAVGHFLLFDWSGDEVGTSNNHNQFKFYAGVMIGTMGTAWFFSASNTYLSWLLKTPAFRKLADPRIASLVGINTGAGSLGRFLGPTVFAAVAPIDDIPGANCVASNPERYLADGCYLKNADAVIGTLAGAAMATAISCYLYHTCTSPSFAVEPMTEGRVPLGDRSALSTPASSLLSADALRSDQIDAASVGKVSLGVTDATSNGPSPAA